MLDEIPTPFLPAIEDPNVDYFGAIEAFAKERFKALVSAIIADLRKMPAIGWFEETAKPLRNVWDEWCWYQANYDNDCGDLSDAFETTLDTMIEGHVAKLPPAEAVLLSCAVCEDQSQMPARNDHELCVFLRELVTEVAGSRSMAEFEEEFDDEDSDDEDEDEDEDTEGWDTDADNGDEAAETANQSKFGES